MKLKNIIWMAILVGSLAGCKKTWLDVNTNPNTLPSSTPDFLFTNALTRLTTNFGITNTNVSSSGGGNVLSNELGSYWSGQWTQSSSYILSPTIFSYLFTNTDFNYWDGWYDILADFDYAERGADEAEQGFFKGPSRVMKVFIFQQIVDVYGNVPYSEALKGSAILFPKFDDQKTIYEGLIKDLDSAITYIKANPFNGAGSAADVLFRGNSTNWIQLANSLKLRILIRQSRIAGRSAYIIAELNKAAASTEGFLPTGLDVGINPGWLATAGKTNPYYDRFAYDANGATRAFARFPRPTKFLFDVLKATNDTFRMKRLAYAIGGENTATPGISTRPEIIANYLGVPFGVGSGYTAPSTSYIGPSVFVKGKFDKPYHIFIAAETQFLLAEAKQLYGAGVNLTGTAQGYYEQGVKESFRLTGTAAAEATTLLTSGINEADWTASTDKLKAIWMQKWIALTNFGGLEAWAEYRRTNYPNTPESSSAPVGAPRPLRLFYPGTEQNANTVNVLAQGTVDVFKTRIFWDID
jgi:Starch-binding associating with outer membrane